MFTFSQTAEIAGGKILAQNHPGGIEHFLTDSRKLVNPRAAVFLAIDGHRHDGHAFIAGVFERGVRQFIIEKKIELPPEIMEVSNILLVDNAISALQKIAAYHRRQFTCPVIGITGSNGKTIVKEWLAQMLQDHYKIIKSPGSYNSQLGGPLSVLQMARNHTLAIFEAGISKTGEMKNLQKVIAPDIGIFTNIGTAHDSGFENREQKAIEKWQFFHGAERVVYCADHELIRDTKPADMQSFTWGRHAGADVRILSEEKGAGAVTMRLAHMDRDMEIVIPFSGKASIENAMHCITTLISMDIPADKIAGALGGLRDVGMRLQLKKGINNCYLIDDSYNNDLGGLQVAIDFLKNQPGSNKRIILSDILQTGMNEEELYAVLNKILIDNQIDNLIGIGEGFMKNKRFFSVRSSFYPSTEAFLESATPDDFHSEAILIKGARPFGFERITNFLSEKVHGTVLEINLDALNNNLNFYRSKLKSGVKLMVMVKASAYGSGSTGVAHLLEYNRVDYLAVAYPDEGVELRKQGVTMPVMVMNVAPESFENIIDYELEPEIYSPGQLEKFIHYIRHHKKKTKIHIKIDSGMHRLGFEEKHIKELIEKLREAPLIEIASIYSHLAGADEEEHNEFSKEQVSRFLAVAGRIEKSLKIHTLKHILNSAGIIRFPEYQFDMVRLGIGLYGFEANQMEQKHLQPISTLKTVISQVKHVKKGETVGYSRKGVVNRDSTIATIAIGYADGFSRAFSNGRISLLVNGQRAPVIGNVCMDMSMIDITGIEANEGDEVIVFGEEPTIKELADAIGTIPYEILTNISSRVTRVFYTG